MAKLDFEGMDELEAAFRRIGNVSDEAKRETLAAMAAVALPAIRQRGQTMGVHDPESGVHILDNISTTKAKLDKTGGYQDITFTGTRTRGKTRTRNSEIAFVNEYGKRGQAARPFIGTALREKEKQIAEAGAAVLSEWIEKEFEKK